MSTPTARWLRAAATLALLPFFGTTSLQAQDPAAEPLTSEFPDSWFWHTKEQQRARHRPLIGKAMPKLELAEWMNGEVTDEDMKGKVVVVDFWATWCGPCIRSIPHNNELVEQHGDDGLAFIGVCGSKRGQDKMAAIAESKAIGYPIAKDPDQKSARNFEVQWWPTYAVADHNGTIRAIGLKPDRVADVVEKLLEERNAAMGTGVAEASASKRADLSKFREDRKTGRKAVDALEGKTPPALAVADWLNTKALKLSDLKGKVVMVDFWATWCGPCIRSIPHNNELASKHADDGLVVIGVCHPRGCENMEATAKEHGIEYPIVKDPDGKTIEAWQPNGFPDYYFVDHTGALRIADCRNSSVDEVIEILLREKKAADQAASKSKGEPAEASGSKKDSKEGAEKKSGGSGQQGGG